MEQIPKEGPCKYRPRSKKLIEVMDEKNQEGKLPCCIAAARRRTFETIVAVLYQLNAVYPVPYLKKFVHGIFNVRDSVHS
jgi:hypothetical protein